MAASEGSPASPIAASTSSPLRSSSTMTPHIRIVPHLESTRSLVFGVIERDVPENTLLKIGRFTDKIFLPNRITFKSKVVSRGHAEIWTEQGKFFIRDTKSSSGTFLNHIRLSPPNSESRPFQLKDGDVVQLGVDYQGGTEEIYRCVKMRLELNRSWQHQMNPYSLNTFQSLRNLTTPPNNVTVLDSVMANTTSTAESDHNAAIEDCCICLYAIAPFQALFVAPCSHTFHYKCCRPLLQNHPGFLCPLCRTYADLEASVAVEASEVLALMSSRKQLKVPQEQNHSMQRANAAESSGDAQTPVTNEADPDGSSALYKVTTLNESQPAVVQRTDSVGHNSTGGGSNTSERLPDTHTPTSVDA